ncbi:MAG: DUF2207 domain-containing protein [Microbacteriaceae bacterium]
MRATRRLAAAIAAAALLVLPAVPAAASTALPLRAGWAALPGDTSDFEFRSFDAVYTLTRGADRHAALDVVETAVAVFPSFDQNRGIIRSIPDYYGDVYLDTRVLGVTDENGADVYYEVQHDGGFTIVVIDDDTFKHGATTYVIHYTQVDTIRAFEDTASDEFYWDVNGTGWDQPFGEVSAQVNLDTELAGALTGSMACYQGAENSSTPCSGGIEQVESAAFTGAIIEASTTNLGPRENLTVSIGFEAGTFVEGEPAPGGSPYEPVDLGPPPPVWAVLLALAGGGVSTVVGIVGAAVLRRKRATPTDIIIPQYSVPDLDVMVAAELIERRSTALPAQFVSLAVKKKIRLLGYPVQDADTADYAVQFVDSSGLESWEQAVVDALFGPDSEIGAARDLQRSGDSELADALRPIVTALPGAVTESGFIGPSVRSKGSAGFVWAAVIATALGVVGAFFAGWVGFFLGLFSFAFGIIGIGTAAFAARKRPTLSAHGAETVDYLLGMKMYLDLAEKDRFRVLQSATGADRIDTSDGRQIVKLYEKLLPWAVIWGVEDSWARELQVHLEQTGEQLDWYQGVNAFQAYQFTSLLSGVHSGINPPVSTSGSSWSGSGFSSFSGGSFGGGFSGGGGGGGGGGGR